MFYDICMADMDEHTKKRERAALGSKRFSQTIN